MLSTRKGIVYFVIVYFMMIAFSSVAQMTQDQFGKNRIQYKKFNWKYISTDNFDIYYYFEGESLSPIAATHAEAVFKKLERSLGYSNMNKTKIVLYNSLADLQQSNIGLQQGTFVGGATNLVKATVEVAFTGDLTQFREDLTYGIGQSWINVILFGGSFKEVLQSSYFLSLPEWYIRGAARYVSEGWSREMDNYMRDLAVNDKIKNPSSYSGQEAEWIGQSLWHYISVKYGADMFTNILQITRIYRSDKGAIEGATGVYYQEFIESWKAYYKTKALEMHEANLVDTSFTAINGKNGKGRDLTTAVLSKDGKYMAYSSNYKGKYSVYIKDLETGKRKELYSGGFKLTDQIPILRNPLLAWQNETTLAFILYRRGKIIYKTIDIKTGKKYDREIEVFHQINSFSFSQDGKYIAFSADEKGQTDIWLYDIESARYLKVTNDEYDDHSPRFGPGNNVIFSSNRTDDTLTITRFESAPNYSLFIYKPGSKILKRIPAQQCNYTQPSFYDANTILYLNDNNGVLNLYKQDLISGNAMALTNSMTDIAEYDINTGKKYLSFIARSNGKEHVYIDTLFSLNNTFSTLTSTSQAIYAKKKLLPPEKPKTSNNLIVIQKKSEDDIDLDKVYFESDSTLKAPVKAGKPASVFIKLPPRRNIVPYYGPYDYKNLFSTDKVATTFQVDPLRGFGLLIESNMTDMMANHRFNMGLFGMSNLKSNSVFAEYTYLKNRIDLGARFDRVVYFANNGSVTQKYVVNKFAVSASYPLSVYSRITVSPFVLTNRFSDLTDYAAIITYPDGFKTFAGTKFELVYDNTTTFGMNMIEGTRAKIVLDCYKGMNLESQNFNRLNIDVRHYQKVHRGIVLALRGAYGRFFGQSPKSFVYGGMDNWLFNSTGTGGTSNPLALNLGQDNSDIMFVKYVTNVRGFKYNEQSGQNYFLFNAEFRVPVIKFLYSGSVSSAFLRNFQLIAFTDIGASWNGVSPFSSNNSLNTTVISTPSFTADVTNYRNPFLYGYGLGARTFMLGYYVKFDVAWGVKYNQQLDPRFYLTFGYDF
ncbi:MAG: PD40 domain-containing protein [Cytophagales bacterium]|nr:PD40 domain-containing protein [Cytophaga sp.]